MQHESISVPVHTLSTAVSTAQRLFNHVDLCQKALEAHDEGSAALAPIVETLEECGTELQQLHAGLDEVLSSTDPFIPRLGDNDQQGGVA